MDALAEKVKKHVERRYTMQDCVDCIASKEIATVIDVIHPATGLTLYGDKTLEQCREEYPDAERMTVETFCAWKAELQRTPIQWLETTEERFQEMLCILPPAAWERSGFLVGEAYDHDAGNGRPRFQAFKQIGKAYFQANRPMTVAEFKAQMTNQN